MESDTRDLERDLHSEGYNVLDNDVYLQNVTLSPPYQ